MPTYVIIILMVSSCSLLIGLLFVVRKRERQKKAALESGSSEFVQQPLSSSPVVQPTPSAAQDAPVNGDFDLSDLGGLDDSSLDALSAMPMDVPVITQTAQMSPLQKSDTDKISELVELVSRYQFFQGENLMLFERMLRDQDLAGVEQIIREKFSAQGKSDAATRAQEVTKKLLGSMVAA